MSDGESISCGCFVATVLLFIFLIVFDIVPWVEVLILGSILFIIFVIIIAWYAGGFGSYSGSTSTPSSIAYTKPRKRTKRNASKTKKTSRASSKRSTSKTEKASSASSKKIASKTKKQSSASSIENKTKEAKTKSLKTKKTDSTKTKKNQTIYLLDGSNILHWEKETRGVSLDALCSITDYLKSKRENYYVLFDASAPHVLREKNGSELERFNSLLKNDPSHFKMIPAGTRADEYLLEEARRDPKAVILTNDLYRDHVKLYPDVLNDRERRIQQGMIMRGDKDILFRGINLSIPIKRK